MMPAIDAAARSLVVGMDVGGTKIALIVTDASERLLDERVVATQHGQLAEQVIGLLRTAIEQAEAGGAHIDAIGIALPGHVDTASGTVRLAVNLRAPDLPLASLVERELGRPCFIEHDARAAAIWLEQRGHVDGRGSLVYLSVGTGISAGIVLDGRPLAGTSGLAGEVGHVLADPNGPICPCGLRGCLETVAGGPAIARKAAEAIAAGRQTSMTAGATAADVFLARTAGDELAGEITDRVADHLAHAIRALVLTLGIKRIVIGGGVAAAGPALLEPIHRRIADERAASALVEAAFDGASVELLSPECEAGARGAAVIARQRIGAAQREGVGDR
jgi:glucokinase